MTTEQSDLSQITHVIKRSKDAFEVKKYDYSNMSAIKKMRAFFKSVVEEGQVPLHKLVALFFKLEK